MQQQKVNIVEGMFQLISRSGKSFIVDKEVTLRYPVTCYGYLSLIMCSPLLYSLEQIERIATS